MAPKTTQKIHRERHQPAARAHLGLLEKKKDYKLRAKDQNYKKQALQLLHRKALNKNPDEFHFHMINSKIKDGEHFEKPKIKDPTLPENQQHKQLMKTQDIKYVRMKRTMETKKIQNLQEKLHMIDAANLVKNKHIFFVDDETEMKQFNVVEHLNIHPSLLNRKINRTKLNDLDKIKINDQIEQKYEECTKNRTEMYNELKNRIEREKELAIIENKMTKKKAKKSNTMRIHSNVPGGKVIMQRIRNK